MHLLALIWSPQLNAEPGWTDTVHQYHIFRSEPNILVQQSWPGVRTERPSNFTTQFHNNHKSKKHSFWWYLLSSMSALQPYKFRHQPIKTHPPRSVQTFYFSKTTFATPPVQVRFPWPAPQIKMFLFYNLNVLLVPRILTRDTCISPSKTYLRLQPHSFRILHILYWHPPVESISDVPRCRLSK